VELVCILVDTEIKLIDQVGVVAGFKVARLQQVAKEVLRTRVV